MTLRLRLTLLYVGLLAAALAVTGITGYVIAAHRIYAGLDDSLTLRAQAVALALEPIGTEFNQEDIENNKGELDALASKADLVFQLRRADGTVLYSSAQPPSGSLPHRWRETLRRRPTSRAGSTRARARARCASWSARLTR